MKLHEYLGRNAIRLSELSQDVGKLSPVLREARTDLPGLDDLAQSGIPFVVVGAIAVNVYSGRPRNTQDIDVISHDWRQLADFVRTKFPQLDVEETEAAVRFSQDGGEVIDVLIPYHKIFEIALSDTRQAGKYLVPSVEAMIALKFAAIMGERRTLLRKGQDRLDIATMLSGKPANKIDLEKTKRYLTSLFPQAAEYFDIFIAKLRTDFGV